MDSAGSVPQVGWSTSFEEADWIRERLHPFGLDIGSIVPDGFDAYLRITHPAATSELPAEMLHSLTTLLSVQTRTPDDCWFCIWDGYAWMHGGSAISGHPSGLVPESVSNRGRVVFPNRHYYLYRGDITKAHIFASYPWDLRPDLWWPTDRVWCVATDVDSICTYVGGQHALIRDLRADNSLGTDSITTNDRFERGTDYL